MTMEPGMNRLVWKTFAVWFVVAMGSISGCHCSKNNHVDAGNMDSGIGDPCSDITPCRSGLHCVGGTCEADCTEDMPCPGGGMCSADGRCIGGACFADPAPTGCGDACGLTTPCPSGLYCFAGVCTADCSAALPCPSGQTCASDGTCVGGGNDAGVCTGAASPPGCGNPCSLSMPCSGGTYCLGGSCTADCSPTVACANGGTCSADGHCIGGTTTPDSGVCSIFGAPTGCGDSCSATTSCGSGLYCTGNVCTADCSPAIPCANGGTCSSDGHCIGGGTDGGPHVTCVLGTELDCGGVCVQRLHDPDNCGTCGHRCSASQVCSGGTCGDMCPATSTNCSRACVNVMVDHDNCGSCGHVCPNNQQCIGGTCGCATARGMTLCDDHCVILDSDRVHCGSCGNECLTTCASRAATCDSLGVHCGPAGDGCGNQLECGTCTGAGETCGGAGLPGFCGVGDGGLCHPTTCLEQGVSCGPIGDGCGHVLQCGTCTLPDTCGGGGVLGRCGRPVCSHNTCMDQCPGTTFCLTEQDGDRIDSICFDTSSDASNCGGCGITCGLGTCGGGHCACYPPAIDAGAGNDAGIQYCPPEGCINCGPSVGCVNQMTDEQHCGNCGTVCPSGRQCTNGVCTP
jgi:hypothetical protein